MHVQSCTCAIPQLTSLPLPPGPACRQLIKTAPLHLACACASRYGLALPTYLAAVQVRVRVCSPAQRGVAHRRGACSRPHGTERACMCLQPSESIHGRQILTFPLAHECRLCWLCACLRHTWNSPAAGRQQPHNQPRLPSRVHRCSTSPHMPQQLH